MRDGFVLIALLFLAACKSIAPTAETGTRTAPALEISTISIPFKISQAQLEDLCFNSMPDTLYQDNDLSGDHFCIRVLKQPGIHLSFEPNTLRYRIPLKVWIKAGVETFGKTISKDLNLDLAISFKTQYTVNSKWELFPKTSPDGYEFLAPPVIKFGFIEIPIKSLAEKAIKKSQIEVASIIDQQIAKNLNLVKTINPLIEQLQKPYPVYPPMDLWFSIQPVKLYLSPLISKETYIQSEISVDSYSQIVSPKPENKSNSLSIPLGISSPYNGKSKINLNFGLGLAPIKKALDPFLLNKEFKSGKYSVKIDSFNLASAAGKLRIYLFCNGSFNGNIALEGIPQIDENGNLNIENLDFNYQTKQVLLKRAKWLVKGLVKNQIKAQINNQWNGLMERQRIEINTALKKMELRRGIKLNAEIQDLNVKNVYLDDQQKLYFNCVGNSSIALTIDELNFQK